MNILITGAAGYIGSHVAKQLLETTTYNITILDNLSTGSIHTIEVLKNIRDFTFIELDLKEFYDVKKVLEQNKFDTIIHFAPYKNLLYGTLQNETADNTIRPDKT